MKPPVVVTWRDAWYDASETRAEDWDAECLVNTTGWIRPCPPHGHETCDALHIAGERFPGSKKEYRSVTHIPRVLAIAIEGGIE